MADKDLDSGDGPSLEMPSLGSLFRRKKKGAPEPEPTADERPIDEDAPAPDDDVDADSGTAAPAAADTPAAAAEDATASDDERAVAVDEPAPEDDPTTILDEPAQPTDDAEPEEAAAAAAVDTDADVDTDTVATGEDADEARPLFADEVDDDTEPTAVVPTADAEPEQTSVLSDEGGLADDLDDEADEDEDDAPATKKSAGFALPPVAARVAAIITGAIIGLLAVGLTYLALRGCEAVRDTSTCGEAGLALMIAILILLVVLGSALLGAWKVTDPSSTSFLAVGLLAVVALLFLIEVIFSPWMVVVIPLVAIGTFTLSQWVTEKFIEEADA